MTTNVYLDTLKNYAFNSLEASTFPQLCAAMTVNKLGHANTDKQFWLVSSKRL
jgi:hypothetical protein